MRTPPISEVERSAILNAEIVRYVRLGFRVVHQTPTSAQLCAPKRFAFEWAFLWFLLGGVGILVYVSWYMAQPDTTVSLSVDPSGTVVATSSRDSRSALWPRLRTGKVSDDMRCLTLAARRREMGRLAGQTPDASLPSASEEAGAHGRRPLDEIPGELGRTVSAV